MPRHTPLAMAPVVASIATVWTPTAAAASTSEPDAVIARAERHQRRHQHQPGAVRGGHQERPQRDAGVADRCADGLAPTGAAQHTV